ncbi:hypothetical protein [Cerasicoccus frondis]|uniref:hypothetical protein n=1 Tax=Cerasicoccus frondis TaxID=490090 RepID=UPI0028526C38|nr:hypothetical protein [Cerasicoccus frondis]
MSLVWERNTAEDQPRLHCLILGIGRYEHLDAVLDRQCCVDSAQEFIRFLVKNADRFDAPLQSIECVISDPSIDPAQTKDKISIPDDPLGDKTVEVANGKLENVRDACSDWLDRCREGDIMLCYACSHGVAGLDNSHLLVLEDFDLNAGNPAEKLLDVGAIARFLPARKKAGACWVFYDACQEVLPQLVGLVNGASAYTPVAATVQELVSCRVRSVGLAASRFGQYAEAANHDGLTNLSRALLHGLEKCLIEDDSLPWLVTNSIFHYNRIGDLARNFFGLRLETDLFSDDLKKVSLMELEELVIPVVVSSNPSHLIRNATQAEIHNGDPNQPPLTRPDAASPWKLEIRHSPGVHTLSVTKDDGKRIDQEFTLSPPFVCIELT